MNISALRQHSIVVHFILVAAVKRAISITYSQCVSVALDIQHAKRRSVPCLAVPHVLTLSRE
jgi:hypothetical protein